MAERNPQQIVRPIEVARPPAIDEQLWPINVALMLLAAFVEGVIIARLDFVDPRPLHNAWTWTATLLASIGVGVWLVQRLDNRHVRRSVQLATVLSLLVHAVLVFLMNNELIVVVEKKRQLEDVVVVVPPELEFTVPILAADAPPQDFEAPVETFTPDQIETEPSTRVERPVEPLPAADPAPPAPMPDEGVVANIPQIKRPDETVPRRSETQGEFSRNVTPSPEIPQSQASAPRSGAGQSRPSELDPTRTHGRVETAGPRSSLPAADAPSTADAQRPELPSRAPRRADDVAQSSGAATLPRRVADPGQTPSTAIRPSDIAGRARSTAPGLSDPRITIDRPEASLPRVDRSASGPAVSPNTVVRAPEGVRQPQRDNIAAARPNAGTNPGSRSRATPNVGGTPNPLATANASPRLGGTGARNGTGTGSGGQAPTLEPGALEGQRGAGLGTGTAGPRGSGAGAPDATASVGPGRGAGTGGSRGERPSSDGVGNVGAARGLAQGSGNRRATTAGTGAGEFGSAAQVGRPGTGRSEGQGPGLSPGDGDLAGQRTTNGIAGRGSSREAGVGAGALQTPGPIVSGTGTRPSAGSGDGSGSALSPISSATGGGGRRLADASLPSSSTKAHGVPIPAAGAGGGGAPSLGGTDSSIAANRPNTVAPRGAATSGNGGGAGAGIGFGQGALGGGIGGGGGNGLGSGRPSSDGQPNVGDIARSGSAGRRGPGGGGSSLLEGAGPGAIAQTPGGGTGNAGGSGNGGSGRGTGNGGSGGPQPGDLAGTRTESSLGGGPGGSGRGGNGGGGTGDGTGGGSGGGVPSGALAGTQDGGAGTSGRPNGEGDEGQIAASGVVREGRRAIASGTLEIGPAVAPEIAGGPSVGRGAPGNPNSSGTPDGQPLDQDGTADARSTVGVHGPSISGPSGAAEGPAISGIGDSGAPGTVTGRRDPLGGIDRGEAVADAGGSRRRSAVSGLPSGIGAAEAPAIAGGNGEAQGEAGGIPDGSLGDEPNRGSGGPESLVRTDIGPGGLGAFPTPDAGIVDRRARTDVPDIARESTRHARRQSMGLPVVDGQVRMATDTYRFRRARRYKDAESGGAGQPLARTEEAVEAGLEFLTRAQSPDGSWSLHDFRGKPPAERCKIQSNTAATGLALLTYLGAGYDHYDDKYKEVVRGGLEWLVEHQAENGDLYLAQDSSSNQSAHLYSHAIAAIALCEAYGMTGDERLKAPAQKSIDFIVRSQHREFGGWRYSPIPSVPNYDSDTSVSGWMVMALRSAELAKLRVPPETFKRVEGWLDRATAPGSGGSKYIYYPKGQSTQDPSYGRGESPQMTSIGLLMRMYLGWDRTKPEMVRGSDYLAQTLPKAVENPSTEWQGAYYWYYATQVMFHMRGEHWAKWNERLHPLLTRSQRTEGPLTGSWDPDGPASDMWAQFGGRIYVTTLNLLSLEVYYRHLPIYEDTGR